MSEARSIDPRDLRRALLRGLVLGLPALAIGAMAAGTRAGVGAWLAFAAPIAGAMLVEQAFGKRRPVPAVRIALASLVAWGAAMLGAGLATAQAALAGWLEPVSSRELGLAAGVATGAVWPGGVLALVVAGRLLDPHAPEQSYPPGWGSRSSDLYSLVTLWTAGLVSAGGMLVTGANALAEDMKLREMLAYLFFVGLGLGPSVAVLLLFIPTILLELALACLDRLDAAIFPDPDSEAA